MEPAPGAVSQIPTTRPPTPSFDRGSQMVSAVNGDAGSTARIAQALLAAAAPKKTGTSNDGRRCGTDPSGESDKRRFEPPKLCSIRQLHRRRPPEGLFDRSLAPRHCPHRLASEEVQRIVSARLESMTGPHRLFLRPRPPSPHPLWGPSPRGAVPSRLHRPADPDGGPLRAVRPGELLHVDVKKLGRIGEGGGWKMHGREMGQTGEKKRIKVGYDYLHVAGDDHSRVAFIRSLPDERARPVPSSLLTPPSSSQIMV